MTGWQKTGFLAACVLPLAWLVLGILMLFGSVVLTGSYAFTYLILPALCLLLLWRVIRGSKKAVVKWILCLLILAVTAMLVFIGMVWGHFSIYERATGRTVPEKYESEIGLSNPWLPEADSVGQPLDTEYHYFYNQLGFLFRSEYYALICTYSPEEYAAQVAALDTRCTFHTEPLGSYEHQPLFTLGSYRFRFLEMDPEAVPLLYYPKEMVLIGNNDETREIVLSYYSDSDLDDISSPQDFLEKDCGWKYIR